jgi:hypothetical protein
LLLLRVGVVAVLLMMFGSFAFVFHAVRGMYLHAAMSGEALRGRQGARGAGIAHAQLERRARLYRVIFSKKKLWGDPLRRARAQP